MLSILFLFILVNSVRKTMHQLYEIPKKYSGYDERPRNESFVNMYEIRKSHQKMKLLKMLKSPNISDEIKVKIIYDSYLLDELNPNIVRASNLSKGLRFFE